MCENEYHGMPDIESCVNILEAEGRGQWVKMSNMVWENDNIRPSTFLKRETVGSLFSEYYIKQHTIRNGLGVLDNPQGSGSKRDTFVTVV